MRAWLASLALLLACPARAGDDAVTPMQFRRLGLFEALRLEK